MKNLVLTMSGLLSNLETCYRTCLREGKESELEFKNISSLRDLVKEYLDKYVMRVNQELEQNKYVSDEEVLESIEEDVRKYRELFKLKSSNEVGERRTS